MTVYYIYKEMMIGMVIWFCIPSTIYILLYISFFGCSHMMPASLKSGDLS